MTEREHDWEWAVSGVPSGGNRYQYCAECGEAKADIESRSGARQHECEPPRVDVLW